MKKNNKKPKYSRTSRANHRSRRRQENSEEAENEDPQQINEDKQGSQDVTKETTNYNQGSNPACCGEGPVVNPTSSERSSKMEAVPPVGAELSTGSPMLPTNCTTSDTTTNIKEESLECETEIKNEPDSDLTGIDGNDPTEHNGFATQFAKPADDQITAGSDRFLMEQGEGACGENSLPLQSENSQASKYHGLFCPDDEISNDCMDSHDMSSESSSSIELLNYDFGERNARPRPIYSCMPLRRDVPPMWEETDENEDSEQSKVDSDLISDARVRSLSREQEKRRKCRSQTLHKHEDDLLNGLSAGFTEIFVWKKLGVSKYLKLDGNGNASISDIEAALNLKVGGQNSNTEGDLVILTGCQDETPFLVWPQPVPDSDWSEKYGKYIKRESSVGGLDGVPCVVMNPKGSLSILNEVLRRVIEEGFAKLKRDHPDASVAEIIKDIRLPAGGDAVVEASDLSRAMDDTWKSDLMDIARDFGVDERYLKGEPIEEDGGRITDDKEDETQRCMGKNKNKSDDDLVGRLEEFGSRPRGNQNNKEKEKRDFQPVAIDPDITFDSIGGIDDVISSVKTQIFAPQLNKDIYDRFNIQPPRGIIFHGPPGTGKTMLAKAICNECNRCSSEIDDGLGRNTRKKMSFYSITTSDILSKYYGESEKAVAALFKTARKNSPSIIFIDEMDGILPRRGSEGSGQVVNSVVGTFLSFMDGLVAHSQGPNNSDRRVTGSHREFPLGANLHNARHTSNTEEQPRVMVIGCTNRLDNVDSAFRRPGRFDTEIEFKLPDEAARRKIIELHLNHYRILDGNAKALYCLGQSMPNAINPSHIEMIARRTGGYSPADIMDLIRGAFVNAVSRDKELPIVLLSDLDFKTQAPIIDESDGSGPSSGCYFTGATSGYLEQLCKSDFIVDKIKLGVKRRCAMRQGISCSPPDKRAERGLMVFDNSEYLKRMFVYELVGRMEGTIVFDLSVRALATGTVVLSNRTFRESLKFAVANSVVGAGSKAVRSSLEADREIDEINRSVMNAFMSGSEAIAGSDKQASRRSGLDCHVQDIKDWCSTGSLSCIGTANHLSMFALVSVIFKLARASKKAVVLLGGGDDSIFQHLEGDKENNSFEQFIGGDRLEPSEFLELSEGYNVGTNNITIINLDEAVDLNTNTSYYRPVNLSCKTLFAGLGRCLTDSFNSLMLACLSSFLKRAKQYIKQPVSPHRIPELDVRIPVSPWKTTRDPDEMEESPPFLPPCTGVCYVSPRNKEWIQRKLAVTLRHILLDELRNGEFQPLVLLPPLKQGGNALIHEEKLITNTDGGFADTMEKQDVPFLHWGETELFCWRDGKAEPFSISDKLRTIFHLIDNFQYTHPKDMADDLWAVVTSMNLVKRHRFCGSDGEYFIWGHTYDVVVALMTKLALKVSLRISDLDPLLALGCWVIGGGRHIKQEKEKPVAESNLSLCGETHQGAEDVVEGNANPKSRETEEVMSGAVECWHSSGQENRYMDEDDTWWELRGKKRTKELLGVYGRRHTRMCVMDGQKVSSKKGVKCESPTMRHMARRVIKTSSIVDSRVTCPPVIIDHSSYGRIINDAARLLSAGIVRNKSRNIASVVDSVFFQLVRTLRSLTPIFEETLEAKTTTQMIARFRTVLLAVIQSICL